MKLMDLELNQEEEQYFGFERHCALRYNPQELYSRIDYYKRLIKKSKDYDISEDNGLRIKFYGAIIDYLNNIAVINF